MERIDVILGHKVEYRGSMSRLSMLVLKRRPCGDGGMPNRMEIWHFEAVNVDGIA